MGLQQGKWQVSERLRPIQASEEELLSLSSNSLPLNLLDCEALAQQQVPSFLHSYSPHHLSVGRCYLEGGDGICVQLAEKGSA